MHTSESSPPASAEPIAENGPLIGRLRDGLESVIRGKRDVIDDLLIALVGGGSVLIEDVPGVGKTTLAKTLAGLIDLDFSRIQCTPDLMPADVFGFSVYDASNSQFRFRAGPIFTNVLLVDEINRASPRTQSALLEAMAELQVTIEGEPRQLPHPFLVIATQNPVGYQGTYPLPEAQLDRFMMHLSLDYPDATSEVEMLYQPQMTPHDQAVSGDVERVREGLASVMTAQELTDLQRSATKITVHRDIADYIVAIATETRSLGRFSLGCSPRGSQMLFRASQARAAISGRDYVLPDDVQHLAPVILAHRVVAADQSEVSHTAKRHLIEEVVASVTVPV